MPDKFFLTLIDVHHPEPWVGDWVLATPQVLKKKPEGGG